MIKRMIKKIRKRMIKKMIKKSKKKMVKKKKHNNNSKQITPEKLHLKKPPLDKMI